VQTGSQGDPRVSVVRSGPVGIVSKGPRTVST
jgi:hypothetical protein